MLKRRDFLGLAALTGLSLTLPLTRKVRAADETYPGPYYVFINAGGGWDPRLFFDPTTDPLQNRLTTSVGQVGAISYSDYPIDYAAFGFGADYDYGALLVDPRLFLERHGARLCVLNGVDTETNNHDAGSRAIWSGKLEEGYPSIGALIAAARAGNQPMAFLSAGGYDATAGIVPLTRTGSANDLRKLAFPNLIDPNNPDNLDLYHAGETYARIRAAQDERLGALLRKDYLPLYKQRMGELSLARTRASDLSRLVVPEDLVSLEGYQLGGLENNMRQAQIAIAAFQAGIAATVNLSVGGFDTHGHHDRDAPNRLLQLFTLFDFVLQRIDAAGLSDRTTIFVGSDFARGPFYNGENAGDGKDHWPITSCLALGAGVVGNRVIGSTTVDQLAVGVDPGSLAPSPSGTILKTEHLHHALRRLSGVGDLDERFPLRGEALPLFG